MKLFAKKSLGQHFLNSRHVLDQIIAAAQLKKDELVLEIGPGTGILTEALLKQGVKVVAVEKDLRAQEVLEEKFSEELRSGQLKLIQGDVLEIFNSTSPDLQLLSSNSFALVANIPYYITGAILEKFLEHEPRPNRMVLLVQKEVAERIVARDGKESILSISVKAFGTPKIISNVPRGAFAPAPTVDSAILAINSISADQFKKNNTDISKFFEIVRAGFAHKRKLLVRNLEAVSAPEDTRKAWQELALNANIRAEEVSAGQWILIAKNLL